LRQAYHREGSFDAPMMPRTAEFLRTTAVLYKRRNSRQLGVVLISMLPSLEPLESRQMLSNSALWRIDGDRSGSPTNDQIVIRPSHDYPGKIEAVVNGVVVGSRSSRSLREVLIKSRQGDDQIDVQLGAAYRHLAFRIYGGRGNDQIKGGVERDLLFGGS